jgi:PIN domain nuclease of toxin-antitoxin system
MAALVVDTHAAVWYLLNSNRLSLGESSRAARFGRLMTARKGNKVVT